MPEIVTQHEGYYGINYSQLPALLIEAIKEQQTIIERQGQELRNVTSQLKKKDKEFVSLLWRIEELEANKDTNDHTLVKTSSVQLK